MKVCSIEGCDGLHHARGWCKFHYRRWKTHGDPLKGWQQFDLGSSCKVENCDRLTNTGGFGMCRLHYDRWVRNGTPGKAESHISYHGESRTRLYLIWVNMKSRCYNPKVRSYSDYGAKGIVICDEWQNWIPFRDWALTHGYTDPAPGTPHREGLSIERIDPGGNYEPSNCEWVTVAENSRRRFVK